MIKIFSYNSTLNNYLKNDTLILNLIKFNNYLYDIIFNNSINYNIYNLQRIDNFLNEIINKDHLIYILYEFYEENITYKKLIKIIFQKKPEYIKYINEYLPDFILNCHIELYSYEYLIDKNIILYSPNINFNDINLDLIEFGKINNDNYIISNDRLL